MKIDYHIHTLCSDGIYTIDEILKRVMEKNITSFSITDHDTIDGIKHAKQLSRNKINFVSGLEITCSEFFMEGVGKPFSIHLLGYNFDEDNSYLINILKKRNDANYKVFQSLANQLSSMGYKIHISDVPISCGTVLQLCDVLNYMKREYTPLKQGIVDFINSYNEKLSHVNISLEEGIKAIHHAGGKAVWAHPFTVYHEFQKMNLSYQQVEAVLEYLKSCGLDGIEAEYLSFDQNQRKWLKSKAIESNLIYTAGSDFHGSKGRDLIGVEIEDSLI